MSGTGRRLRVNPLVAGFVAGVIIAVIVGVMATINLQYGAPWASTHTLTAQVSDADSMSVGSDVRIAGRLVGQVTSVQANGDHSTITFHVNESDWPLPADTTANVRLATLLGQKYIQLNPGHSSNQLADNGVIGLQATRPVVDFDQILNTFDKPTRDALTSLIRTVAGGVKNQEGTIQQFIPDLRDLSVHSNIPTQELVTRNSEINNILINLGITADQLDASRNDLAGVIDNLNSVNAALARNEGSALKAFITNTDTINTTTNAVLANGYASKLDSGLQKVGTFAQYLNTLVGHLIPQSVSFTQPVAGAEPSDFINGNDAIPARSAIDLIYEIGDASSQGYGTKNFGTGSSPNVQANSFLRQFQAPDLDPCQFSGLVSKQTNPDPDHDGDDGSWDTDGDFDGSGCHWGQTSSPTRAPASPSSAAQAAPSSSSSAPAGNQSAPSVGPAAGAPPSPSPSATPSPTPSAGSSSGGSGSPPPNPSPSASASPASFEWSLESTNDPGLADFALIDYWSLLFTVRYR